MVSSGPSTTPTVELQFPARMIREASLADARLGLGGDPSDELERPSDLTFVFVNGFDGLDSDSDRMILFEFW